MGLFVYTQKGSIISMVVLPTTEIIEPVFLHDFMRFFYFWYVAQFFSLVAGTFLHFLEQG